MNAAFSQFEATKEPRGAAIRRITLHLTSLRSLARSKQAADAAFARAFIALVDDASARFRVSSLQSYVDVSVRTAAVRAFAGILASAPMFAGRPGNVTTALLDHLSSDRAVLLAHAEVLLDEGKGEDALPIVRRALRMQAVCQVSQRLLAQIEGSPAYDLSERFCPMPFTHLSTSYKGDAFACTCSAWVPYPVGNVIEAASAEAVWNSDAALEIRRSVHDGDFRYCSRTLCSFIAARTLPKKSEITDPELRRYIDERTLVIDHAPDMLQLNHDPSCNLACPSCRPEIITAGPQEQQEYVDAAERVLLPLLRRTAGQTYISGGGEAFASAHYRKILASLNRREFPGLDVYLITNGQLLNAKRWAEFPHLPEMVGRLSISIDAARAATYERLRRPGRWDVLMENLELISRMRAANTIRKVQLNFVVQADNFRELPDFIALGTRLNVDEFWLQRLTNYGSYDEAVFAQADVTSPLHPEHEDLLDILRQPFMDDPRIDKDMLLPILPEYVESGITNPHLVTRTRATSYP